MQNIKKHLSVFIVACFVLVTTLFVPVTVYTTQQERDVRLGYPFPFVIQNSPHDLVEISKPAKYIVATQRETPTAVLWENLFISLMFIFLGLEFTIYLIAKVQSNHKLPKYIGPIFIASGLFFSFFIVAGAGFVLIGAGILAIFLAKIK